MWPQKLRGNVEFVAIQNCFVLSEVLRQISNMVRVEATQRRLKLPPHEFTLVAVYFEQDVRLRINFVVLSRLEILHNKGKGYRFEID